MTDKTFNEEREEFRAKVVRQMAEMGIDILACRSCGDPIVFMKTTSGKWQPVDLYLESHFANCPGAENIGGADMLCPSCKANQLVVYDSRPKGDDMIWRRRKYLKCSTRFTTKETIDASDNRGPGRPRKQNGN